MNRQRNPLWRRTMKRTPFAIAAIAVTTLSLSGCGGSGDESAPAAGANNMPAMPGMSQTAAKPGEHMAQGTLNSVDAAAGTVNISHGAVATATWPAMTMSFKLADPAAAANLKPGDRVDFHFTIESGMSATVTQITPAK